MRTFNKQQLIDNLEATAEKHIRTAIQDFQNLSEKELTTSGTGNGWSIVQCLDHLNSYGRYYLPLIKKSLENARESTGPTFTSGWLGHYFVRTMEPVKGGKKYKAIPRHLPATDLEPYAIVSEFISQQEELLLLLRKARKTALNHPRIPTSMNRFITLRPGDTLRFVIMHNERHVLQALRIHHKSAEYSSTHAGTAH